MSRMSLLVVHIDAVQMVVTVVSTYYHTIFRPLTKLSSTVPKPNHHPHPLSHIPIHPSPECVEGKKV